MYQGWSSAEILAEPGLRITAAEKIEILQRMPPPSAQDGRIYIDGVFEGGGVRGLAFLGALRCIADLGFHWRKVAGTSAGAITASLVAADFPIDELEHIMGEMDFMKFLTQKTSRLIFDHNPADDLRSPVKMLLLLLVARKLGQYSSLPVRQWLEQVLATQNICQFSDIKARHPERDLKVVASDVSRGQMLILPDDLDVIDAQDGNGRSLKQRLQLSHRDHFSVAEAVRLSMSIPLFFEPGELGDRKIVDGGILSNFPLWIYDFQPGITQGSQTQVMPKCPRWPTFGLRLVERYEERADPMRAHGLIQGPFELLGKMFRTMLVARDQYHLHRLKKDRVIELDITAAETSPTEFNLSDEKKAKLYRLGYLRTKAFFLKSWDWQAHLRQRGYNPEDLLP